MPATIDPLPSWNDTRARQAIVQFVEAVTGTPPWDAASASAATGR
jgi:hypothetical protein